MTNYPSISASGRILAERAILYRPRLKLLTGNVNAAILLSQINYWWFEKKQKVFYKFAAPCKHRMYVEGDSWREELAFTRPELQTALKHIGTKIRPNQDTSTARHEIYDAAGELLPVHCLVLYWRDSNNVTWYELNEALQDAHIARLYSNSECRNPASANVTIQHYPANDGIQHSTNDGIQHYPYTESTTENKNTSAKKKATSASRGSQSKAKATPEQPPAAKPRTPAQLANDTLVDALGKAYGTAAVNGDYSRYLKIAQTLVKSGIPCGEFELYVRRVRKIATEQHWKRDWTINALTGGSRMSEYVKARDAYAASQKPDAAARGDDDDAIYDIRLLLPVEMQPEHIRGKRFKEA